MKKKFKYVMCWIFFIASSFAATASPKLTYGLKIPFKNHLINLSASLALGFASNVVVKFLKEYKIPLIGLKDKIDSIDNRIKLLKSDLKTKVPFASVGNSLSNTLGTIFSVGPSTLWSLTAEKKFRESPLLRKSFPSLDFNNDAIMAGGRLNDIITTLPEWELIKKASAGGTWLQRLGFTGALTINVAIKSALYFTLKAVQINYIYNNFINKNNRLEKHGQFATIVLKPLLNEGMIAFFQSFIEKKAQDILDKPFKDKVLKLSDDQKELYNKAYTFLNKLTRFGAGFATLKFGNWKIL